MRKVVIFVLGLVILLFVAKKYLDGPARPQPGESSEAKRRLDHVREKARGIEDDAARRAEETVKG